MKGSSKLKLGVLASILLALSIVLARHWIDSREEEVVMVDAALEVRSTAPAETASVEPARSTVVATRSKQEEEDAAFEEFLSSEPATSSKHELVVHVQDTAGVPVCGVELSLLVSTDAAHLAGTKQVAQSIATTSVDGKAAHRFAEDRLRRGLSQRTGRVDQPLRAFAAVAEGCTRIQVLGVRSGYTKVDQEFVLDLAQKKHDLSVTTSRGLSLRGFVRYADGTPAVGCEILAGSTRASTDERGELRTPEACQGTTVKMPGISGFAPGDVVPLRVSSPRSEFVALVEDLTFELADIEREIVLPWAPRLRVTLRDCGTGQLIRDRNLDFTTYLSKTNGLTEILDRSVETFGEPLEEVAITLQQPGAQYLVIGAKGYVRGCVPVERILHDETGSSIELCLQRVKPFTIRVSKPDGSTAGGVTVTVCVNHRIFSGVQAADGKEVDASKLLQRVAFSEDGRAPVEFFEITQVQCISLDLQRGTLTDLQGRTVALASSGGSPLFSPISLLALPGESWDGRAPLPLEFVIVPP